MILSIVFIVLGLFIPPILGPVLVISMMSFLVLKLTDKKTTIISSVIGVISMIGFAFLLLYFLLIRTMTPISYPDKDMNLSERTLYRQIVNETGYYDPDSCSFKSTDDTSIVTLAGINHEIYNSEGNDKNTIYVMFHPNRFKETNYKINFIDESNEILYSYDIDTDYIARSDNVYASIDSPLTYACEINCKVILLEGETQLFESDLLRPTSIENSIRGPYYEYNSIEGFIFRR